MKKVVVFFISILLVLAMSCAFLHKKNKELKEDIIRADLTIMEYEGFIHMVEDYIEIIIDINDLELKNAVLEERLYWMKREEYDINIIVNDLEDLMEWTIRYYEVETQNLRDEMELWEYILLKDNKLYERILNNWK